MAATPTRSCRSCPVRLPAPGLLSRRTRSPGPAARRSPISSRASSRRSVWNFSPPSTGSSPAIILSAKRISSSACTRGLNASSNSPRARSDSRGACWRSVAGSPAQAPEPVRRATREGGCVMAKVGHEPGGASLRRLELYPEYKDSGVEWLGQMPSHWSVRKWRYCCHVTQGQVPPDDERYRDRIMIAPNHIESGTGRILFTETADEQGAASGKYLVKPWDIIYSKIRPALNKACIATGHWLCSADMYPVAVTADDLTPK